MIVYAVRQRMDPLSVLGIFSEKQKAIDFLDDKLLYYENRHDRFFLEEWTLDDPVDYFHYTMRFNKDTLKLENVDAGLVHVWDTGSKVATHGNSILMDVNASDFKMACGIAKGMMQQLGPAIDENMEMLQKLKAKLKEEQEKSNAKV